MTGVRSGRFASSTGVGTATMWKSAAFRSLGSVVKRMSAWARSASWTSSVLSWPALRAATRAALMSKPTTRASLPNATATGRPT